MSETAAALGVGGTWEFEGKQYKLAPRSLTTEALFEVFVQENAINAIRRMHDRLQPHEYQAQMDGWRRDVAGLIYSFDGVVCLQAMLSTPGAKHLAFLQLAQENPQARRDVIDRLYADAKKWSELMERLGALNNRPNSQGSTPEEAPARD